MALRPAQKKPQNSDHEEGWSVRFLLVAALALLFLWLCCAQTQSAPPCEASPGTAVSLLLSPLLLYSWLTSTLAKVLLASPALVLMALHQSLLLLLAGPWALLCFWGALALACLQAAVYLLHLTLAAGAAVGAAVLTPGRDDDAVVAKTPENRSSD